MKESDLLNVQNGNIQKCPFCITHWITQQSFLFFSFSMNFTSFYGFPTKEAELVQSPEFREFGNPRCTSTCFYFVWTLSGQHKFMWSMNPHPTCAKEAEGNSSQLRLQEMSQQWFQRQKEPGSHFYTRHRVLDYIQYVCLDLPCPNLASVPSAEWK